MGEPASIRFFGRSAEYPIVFSGPPQRLVGRVHLRNAGAASVVLRRTSLSDAEGRFGPPGTTRKIGPIVLRAAEERAVHFIIALDPTMAPGEYRVDLDVTGQVRPAILNVVESASLRVEPSRLVILRQPGGAHRTQLVATNEGNMPLVIGGIGEVELHPDAPEFMLPSDTLATAIAEPRGRRDSKLSALLLALIPARGPVAGRLQVTLPDGPVNIAPGESRRVPLEIAISEDLPASGRFHGRAVVLTTDLDFLVIEPALDRLAHKFDPENPPKRDPNGGGPARRKK